MLVRIVLSLIAIHLPAEAEVFSIKEITYAEIEEFAPEVIDFEGRRLVPNAGLLIYSGVTFGERFAGQTIASKQDEILDWHDVLKDEAPYQGLVVLPGAAQQDLVVRHDRHWGSMALHPVGPSLGPWPDRNLGRGALAMRFDPPICFLALRTAVDGMSRYKNVNETVLRGKNEGSLNIRFYDEQGRDLASFMRSINPESPIEIGYMQAGQVEPQIAGVFLQGLDLGGFAIDDVRFDPECPLKLF